MLSPSLSVILSRAKNLAPLRINVAKHLTDVAILSDGRGMVAQYTPTLILEKEIKAESGLPEAVLEHFRRGNEFGNAGEYAKALQEYEAALKTAPNLAEVHYNRGVALVSLGHHKEALAAFEEAIRLKPDFALAHSNRGIALHSLGRYEEALAAFEEAIKLKPDYYAEAHSNRGATLGILGRYKEALGAFEKAMALQPDFAAAREGHLLAVELLLRRLVRSGFGSWRGGKPKGYDGPVTLTPGPPISSYIIEDRR